MEDNFAYGSEKNSRKGHESRRFQFYHVQAYPKLIMISPKLITIAPKLIENTPKLITDFSWQMLVPIIFLTANYISGIRMCGIFI
jgi:hypothetical protein